MNIVQHSSSSLPPNIHSDLLFILFFSPFSFFSFHPIFPLSPLFLSSLTLSHIQTSFLLRLLPLHPSFLPFFVHFSGSMYGRMKQGRGACVKTRGLGRGTHPRSKQNHFVIKTDKSTAFWSGKPAGTCPAKPNDPPPPGSSKTPTSHLNFMIGWVWGLCALLNLMVTTIGVCVRRMATNFTPMLTFNQREQGMMTYFPLFPLFLSVCMCADTHEFC